jgi:hypothetical protein
MSQKISLEKKNTTKWQRSGISFKIIKVLAALCVVAAVKLAVLGSLGIDLWQELAEQDMLPVPSALAAQAAKSAKSGKAAKPAPADPDAPADLAAPLAEALGEGGMLAESAIPQPKVGESREAGAANRREAELAAKERALTAMEKALTTNWPR